MKVKWGHVDVTRAHLAIYDSDFNCVVFDVEKDMSNEFERRMNAAVAEWSQRVENNRYSSTVSDRHVNLDSGFLMGLEYAQKMYNDCKGVGNVRSGLSGRIDPVSGLLPEREFLDSESRTES